MNIVHFFELPEMLYGWFDCVWLFSVCFVGSIFTALICGKNSEKNEINQTRRTSNCKSSPRKSSAHDSFNPVEEKKVSYDPVEVKKVSTSPTSKTKKETTEDIEKEKKTRYMTLNDIELEMSLRHADIAHANLLESRGIKVVEKKSVYEELDSQVPFKRKPTQDNSVIRRLVQNAMKPGQPQDNTELKKTVRYPDQTQHETAARASTPIAPADTIYKTAKELKTNKLPITEAKTVKGGGAPKDPRRESVAEKDLGKMVKDSKDAKPTKPATIESILKKAPQKDVKDGKKAAMKESQPNELFAKLSVKKPCKNEPTVRIPGIDEMKGNPGKFQPRYSVKNEAGDLKFAVVASRRQSAPADVDPNCRKSLTDIATQKNEGAVSPINQKKPGNLNANVKVP